MCMQHRFAYLVGSTQGGREAGLLGGHEGERGGEGAEDEGGEDVVYIQAQLALVAHDPRQ